jgi:hypothetical protein
MIDQKQLENLKYFDYLGSTITNDASIHVKLNPELPWKSSIQQEENYFHQQTGHKFKEETSKVLCTKAQKRPQTYCTGNLEAGDLVSDSIKSPAPKQMHISRCETRHIFPCAYKLKITDP